MEQVAASYRPSAATFPFFLYHTPDGEKSTCSVKIRDGISLLSGYSPLGHKAANLTETE